MNISKKMVSEEYDKLTIESLTISPKFREHLMRRIKGITQQRINLSLTTDKRLCPTAMTDGSHVTINTKAFTEDLPINLAVLVVEGMLFHELGHIIYTNFKMEQTFFKNLVVGKWTELDIIPYGMIEEKAWKEIQELVQKKKVRTLIDVFKALFNIIEDAHIEPRLMESVPGWGRRALSLVREIHEKSIPSVEDTLSKYFNENWESKPFDIGAFFNILLGYAKFGLLEYSTPNVYTDKIVENADVIEKAILSKNWKTRTEYAVHLLLNIWAESGLQNLAEKEIPMDEIFSHNPFAPSSVNGSSIGKQQDGECDASSSPSSAARSKSLKKAIVSKKGSDDSSDTSNDDNTVSSSNTCNDSKPEDESDDESGNESDDESGNESDDESGDKSDDESGNDGYIINFNNSNGNFESNSAESSCENQHHKEINSVTSKEGGRFDLKEGCINPSNEDDDSWEYDDMEGGAYAEYAASDIISMLEEIAEENAAEKMEKERAKSMNEFANSMDYSQVGKAHSGVAYVVHRIPIVPQSLIDAHEQIVDKYLPTARLLSKKFEKLFEPNRKKGYQKNLYMGSKLNPRAYYKDDGKVFKKKNVNDKRSVAVALLLDESGSMSYNNRTTTARLTSLILYEACKKVDIPILIVGHDSNCCSSRPNVNLYNYVEFDSVDDSDKYRLMDISSRSCNRDGAALMYVCNRLEKRPETNKIVIVISDGQPAAVGYEGKKAMEDLRSIKKFYSKRGLHIFAAAIGEDRDAIHNCYEDGFLDISRMDDLPNTLFNVISRYIR